MRTHTDIRKYKCQFCEKTFRASDNLSKHINSQHTRTRTYVCEVCSRVFYCNVNLLTHMKCHSDEKFQCNECGKSFKTKRSLKAHLFRHTGIRSYVCLYCDARFVTKSEMQFHEKFVHLREEMKHKCDVCGHKCSNKTLLDTHMRKHTDQRPFECKICREKFRRKETLAKHQLTHSSEKPFKCHLCLNSYKEAFSLKKHVKQVHSTI